jgi:hypothetical protein
VYALNASTGGLVQEYNTGWGGTWCGAGWNVTCPTTSPAVTGVCVGSEDNYILIYVGSEDTYVYAFILFLHISLSVSIHPLIAFTEYGLSQTFTATVSNGTSPYKYQWYLGDSPLDYSPVPGATSSSYVFVCTSHTPWAHLLYVKVTDSASPPETAQSFHALIFVLAATSVTISPSSVIMNVGQHQWFNSTVLGGVGTSGERPQGTSYSYQWYLNGVAVVGATNSSWNFTPTHGGDSTVTLKVTDFLGVTATSNNATVMVESHVTFNETGLPSGTQWSVTFNGQTQSSTSNSIAFNAVNGVYTFSVTTYFGHAAWPSSGSITVSGTNVAEQIIFIRLILYRPGIRLLLGGWYCLGRFWGTAMPV